ncbi:hypothetical protein JW887_03390 [Candidatus Dojkabacteria bacterium]|nr:hypothetical protein [Candidatus Dojkabacteria bacterium]
MKKDQIIKILQIIAKVWSALCIFFVLFMFLGNIFSASENDGAWKPIEIVAALFFPIGMTIGMVIGWKKNLIGGLITIFSMIMFYSLILIPRGVTLEQSSRIFFLLFFPGFLFTAAGLLDMSRKHK